VKRGLHHAALADVELAFTREQAVAENPTRALQHQALDELALLVHQQFADKVRMIDDVEPLGTHPRVHDVTMTRDLAEEADGITPQQEVLDWRTKGRETGTFGDGRSGRHNLFITLHRPKEKGRQAAAL